jgi:hypothetical protein
VQQPDASDIRLQLSGRPNHFPLRIAEDIGQFLPHIRSPIDG